ncbi:MAG: CHASE3 domain-containing protein, partial [Leptolyngbyaceae cyanobacterium bins.59]|nr:CHASE3 domain-containing protein [Leptolyngbyaceae cyanobacterium bins.59]
MRQRLGKQLFGHRLGLALLNLLVLLGVGFVSFHNTNTLLEAIDQEVETQRKLTQLQEILALTVDIETGRRGFILSGQER